MMKIWRDYKNFLNRRFDFRYLRFIRREEPRLIQHFLDGFQCDQSNIKFSILTPTYGIDLKYVKEFMASLFLQTYTNWELCLCIDGRQPDIENYFAKLQKKYPLKIKFVVKEKNEGIDAATYAAGKLITGDYVCLIDSDDTIHKQTLEVLACTIKRNGEAEFIYTDNDYLTDWGLRNRPVVKPSWNPELLKLRHYINHLTVVSQQLYRDCEFILSKNNKGVQDWIFNRYAAEKAKCIVHIPLMLYHWRAREGSLATGPQGKPHVVKATIDYLNDCSGEVFSKDVRFETATWNYQLTQSENLAEVTIFIDQVSPSNKESLQLHADETLLQAVSRLKLTCEALRENYCLLQVEGQPKINGDLSRVLTFALGRDAGLAWPHRQRQLPTEYRFNTTSGTFVPTTRDHSFCNETLTVLAGPLHSTVVGKNLLIHLCDEILKGPDAHLKFVGKQGEGLGVALSLAANKIGLRNVSVRGAYCDQELSAV